MSNPSVLLARQAMENGQIEQVQGHLATALQQDPQDDEAWLLFGDVMVEPEKRLFSYRRALELNPSNTEARGRLERLSAPDNSAVTMVIPSPHPVPEAILEDEARAEDLPEATPPVVEAPTGPDASPTMTSQPEEDLPSSAEFLMSLDEPAEKFDLPDEEAAPTMVINRQPPQEELEPPLEASPTLPDVQPEPAAQEQPASLPGSQGSAEPTLVAPRYSAFDEPAPLPAPEPADATLASQRYTAFSEPQPTPEPQPLQPAASIPAKAEPLPASRPPRPRRARDRKSPLRFLLFIFPLMLLAMLGLAVALLLGLIR